MRVDRKGILGQCNISMWGRVEEASKDTAWFGYMWSDDDLYVRDMSSATKLIAGY